MWTERSMFASMNTCTRRRAAGDSPPRRWLFRVGGRLVSQLPKVSDVPLLDFARGSNTCTISESSPGEKAASISTPRCRSGSQMRSIHSRACGVSSIARPASLGQRRA